MSATTAQLVDLREGYAIAHGGRVDAARGIIYGAKLLGRYSQNSHDIPGAESTEYTPEAMRQGVSLYEGAACYRGHGDRDDKDRDPAEKIGVIRQARIDGDCIRGDLHLFNPKAEFSATLLEAAANNPDGFAMSHNASGKWELRGTRAVIVEIRRVKSVDCVGSGGTNASLFESHRPKKKGKKPMTFKESLLALFPGEDKRIVRLLEAGDMGGMPMPEAGTPPPEDEATADEHLGNAVMAIYKADMPADEKKRKILAILKLSDEPVSGVPPEEEEEDNLEESAAEECDADGKPKYPKAMKESLQRKLKRAELREQVRDLCESKKLAADKTTVDDLANLGSLDAATRWIDRLQQQADPMRRQPRSKARGTTDVTESAETGLPTVDELVSALPT